jgi:hypothetical protein
LADKLNLAWDQWLYGIAYGFIGGGASAVVSGPVASMLAPNEINLVNWSGASKMFLFMLITFLFSGAISMFMYLKNHPLPDIQTVTTTTTTVAKSPDTGTVVVAKVEETHTEPKA